MRETTRSGQPFSLRPYQREAAEAFYAAGAARGGSGVITLPCGAGKTIVAMACMERLQTSTLVLTTSVTAARQWISELLDKTSLHENRIAEYSGDLKQVREVTVATYQIMTWRPNRESGYPHLSLFESRNWGLIIYDEVHLLPAPVFRVTAALQARRRLGLTATLDRLTRSRCKIAAAVCREPLWMLQQGQSADNQSARECLLRQPPHLVSETTRSFVATVGGEHALLRGRETRRG
jgi:DNA excision repair protein ERCC-3